MEVLSNYCIMCKDGKVEKKHSCYKTTKDSRVPWRKELCGLGLDRLDTK